MPVTLVFHHLNNVRLEITRVRNSPVVPRIGERVSLSRGTFVVTDVEYEAAGSAIETVRVFIN